MFNKEVRIKHSEIGDTKTITQVTTKAMEGAGCDIHTHEVAQIDDDFKTGERILKVEKQGEMFFGIGANMSQDRWNNIFKKGI